MIVARLRVSPRSKPMNRLSPRICLLAFACLQILVALSPNALAQQKNPQNFAISKDVDLVLLPVMVRNAKGQFVSGLDASDFRVYEKGRPQKISLFRSEDVPVTVGILVDHSRSMAAWRDQVIRGAGAFVQASNLQDKEFVVNFGNSARLTLPPNVQFTSNAEELQNALSVPYASGKTTLYDALAAALQHIQASTPNKKVLLLISDGGDNASQRNFSEVLKMAQTANVLIYSIGLLDELSADQNPGVLKKLALATGGESYFPASEAELIADCRLIARDIRHQYTLGYNPTDDNDSGYRKIRVRVSATGRGKLIFRTRTDYFLPPATPPRIGSKHSD